MISNGKATGGLVQQGIGETKFSEGIDFNQIDNNYDVLENEMLREFFDFA